MVRRPSAVVRQQFQTSSPLKPLGKSKPNFMWRGVKVDINGPGHMTKMAAMPIYGNLVFINEPCHEKTNILGPTQTRLYSYKRWHGFGFRK